MGDAGRCDHVLVVTTRYHWRAALGGTLEEVFDLTSAEQGVVRALAEDLGANRVLAERGTSAGPEQINSCQNECAQPIGDHPVGDVIARRVRSGKVAKAKHQRFNRGGLEVGRGLETLPDAHFAR